MTQTARAEEAWADYVALGSDRTLEKLLALYQMRPAAPTKQLSTLKRWSQMHGWQQRLQAITDRAVQEAEAKELDYRRSIMEAGFGLAHERVRALKELAGELLADLTERRRRWVKDVKQIGSGEGAERVTIKRFNHQEVEQFRGVLDDIAKEQGQRVRRTEVGGIEGGAPITVAGKFTHYADDELDAAIERLAAAALATGQGIAGELVSGAGAAPAGDAASDRPASEA